MKKYQAKDLIAKYLEGTATPEERIIAEQWFFRDLENSTYTPSQERIDEADKKITAKLMNHIGQHAKAKMIKLWPLIASAAAILIFLSIGLSYYLNKTGITQGVNQLVKHDIAPGGNKAILTLANGKQVILTNAKNGKLAQQGSTQINKTADGQIIYNASQTVKGSETTYNTITTPRGGQYLVILPDSSKVYLDAASSLRFPIAFAGNIRTVVLTGEAYFEVAHNKSKPFHVITKGQTVEVLGTHFNINAYDDERSIKTTLLEGSVRVSIEGHTAMLTPGEQAQIAAPLTTLTKGMNEDIKVIQNVNTDEAVAWKNGFFQFENADIQTIMRQFSRWYNVDVIYRGKVQERLFSGEIHRNLTAIQALDLLNYANVHFYIDGKKIIISP